jgi:putative chitinase
MITREQFVSIMPHAVARISRYVDFLNAAMEEFAIDTAQRQAMWLAQLAHESGSLRYTKELASGAAYEGREDLGNTHAGDGVRFKGRGLMQITGRKNTGLCSVALYGDERLLEVPELLEEPKDATRSAAWFWRVGAGLNLSSRARAHGIKDGCDLNDVADAGDFLGTILAINGGTNGKAEREAIYATARKVLGV